MRVGESDIPTRAKSKDGFALLYSLLVSVVFMVFFAALVYYHQGTLRTVRHSEDLTKAKALAALANDFVFQMVRDGSVDWEDGLPWRFTNIPGDADYFRDIPSGSGTRDTLSKEALGGHFEVTIRDAREVDGVEVPEGGTYLLSTARAKVGNRETLANDSSRFLFKLGVPFINNLNLVVGTMTIHNWSKISGPVFVAESEDGSGGNVTLLAHHSQYDHVLGQDVQIAHTGEAEGTIQARGEVRLINRDATDTDVVKQVIPKGRIPAGTEITTPPEFLPSGGTGIGGLRATGDLLVEPNVSLRMEVSNTEEIFERLDQHSGIIDIDLDSLGADVAKNGVLVEVSDSQLRVHEVRRQFAGRAYDLSMVYSIFHPTEPAPTASRALYHSYAGTAAQRAQLVLDEVRWHDPPYDEKPVPTNLKTAISNLDLNGDGSGDFPLADIPDTTDAIDYYSIEAGTLLNTIELSRSQWKIVRFRSSELSSETNGTSDTAPPVYIRGRVEGKLFLAYEYDGPNKDDWLNKGWEAQAPNSICVLSDPGESGVPAGITLADPNVQLDPEATGTFSPDQVILACNGAVTAGGLPIFHLRWLAGEPGGDLADIGTWESTKDWEVHRDLFRERIPAGSPDDERMTATIAMAPAPFYAIGVSRRPSYHNHCVTANDKQRTDERSVLDPGWSAYEDYFTWADYEAEYPVPPSFSGSTRVNAMGLAMRTAFQASYNSTNTFGAQAFLLDRYTALGPGDHQYDYRWRSLDANTLTQDMGLDVTPILIERRGL